MTKIQTPFGTEGGRYPFLGSMALENAHVEIQKGGPSEAVVVPSEGLLTHSSVTETPCRGMIYLEDLDYIYDFRESSVYKVNSAGTATYVGAVPGIDRVQITRNKKTTPQITVRTDAAIYYIESDQVRILNDADLPSGVVSVETLGEFTLFGHESGRISYSTQGETSTVDALDFFTAESSPDKLIRLKVDNGELFAFSQYSTDVFRFAGADVDEPFLFRTSIARGCLSRDSVASSDGTLMFVGVTKEGEVGVYRMTGYVPKKISTHEIDRLIEADASQSSILGFSYGKGGHSFYVLTGTNWTRVYDAVTGEWHSRKSYMQDTWRAQFAVQAWGRTILGDKLSGKELYLDPSTYTEDGTTMIYKVRSGTMDLGPDGGIVDRVSLDFLTGQGVTTASAQGFEPYAMLSYSDDGGNRWSNPRNLKLGRQGRTQTRVRTHRLGKVRDKGRIWEIAVSDPVGRALASVDVKVRR